MKRIFDFVVSFSALLVLWPFILSLVLLIRLNLGTPVLFRQLRPGLNGKLFEIYKFRTMALAYDKQGELLPDSERMTVLGSFIRSRSLDELPQLINVLRGDLSLVGPRPLLPEYLPLYSTEQNRRHEARPGITGWAQVNGRNAITWEEKFKLDVWYVDHQSFWLDMRILWMTVKKVFSGSGVNQPGQATAEKFRGSQHG